jgi:hypothetical protein
MPDPRRPWERLALSEADWRSLASAFYALAHGDPAAFDALPTALKAEAAGQLCSRYRETGEHALLEQAGRLLTGTSQWYVYLGR